MNEITVSAKTLDDAITEALIQLGVTSDQLDYDVIEKGSAGFLGIGMKQAVIRARKKAEPKPEPKQEYKKAEPVVKEHKPLDNIIKQEEKKSEKKQEELVKEVHTKEEKQIEEVSRKKPEVKLAEVEEGTVKACEKFLHDVLKAMDMEVEITSEVDEEGALSIKMTGNNMGILIGKRGQTLDSLQYLTNRIANKMQDGYVRVKLDTEDYRKRRQETLEILAKNIAHKVRKTRRPVSLEPMNPYERRVIHSALQGDKSVTTHSEGEEPYRRVVVTLVRR